MPRSRFCASSASISRSSLSTSRRRSTRSGHNIWPLAILPGRRDLGDEFGQVRRLVARGDHHRKRRRAGIRHWRLRSTGGPPAYLRGRCAVSGGSLSHICPGSRPDNSRRRLTGKGTPFGRAGGAKAVSLPKRCHLENDVARVTRRSSLLREGDFSIAFTANLLGGLSTRQGM